MSGESQRAAETDSQIAKTSTLDDEVPRHTVLQERTPDPSVESQESTRLLDTEAPDERFSLQSQMTSRRQFVSDPSNRLAPVANMLLSAPSKAIKIHFPTNKVPPVTPRRSARLSGGISQDISSERRNAVEEGDEPDLPPTSMDMGLDGPKTPAGLSQTTNSTPRKRRGTGQKPSSSTPARRSTAVEGEEELRRAQDVESNRDREDAAAAYDVEIKEELKRQLMSELRQLEEEVISLEGELSRVESENRLLREKPPDQQGVNRPM